MNYKVLLHESEEGFSVSCPGLPGCWSQGQTEEGGEDIEEGIGGNFGAGGGVVEGGGGGEKRCGLGWV